jgi:hypothetical protein
LKLVLRNAPRKLVEMEEMEEMEELVEWILD